MRDFQQQLMEARSQRLQNHVAYYQYQPIENPHCDRMSLLERDKIWMSDPEKFNDPLDLRLPIKDFMHRSPFHETERLRSAVKVLTEENTELARFWFYDEPLIEAINGWAIHGDHHENIIAQAKRRFNQFGVACFTDTCSNSLMWSHYASQHKGFCVEYAARPIDMALASENLAFYTCHVQYVTTLPEICISEVLFSPHQVMKRMLATKMVEWAYEREWRLIHFEKKGQKVGMPKHMQISALIAGVKMESDKISVLKETAHRLGVPVLKMERKHGGELVAEPL